MLHPSLFMATACYSYTLAFVQSKAISFGDLFCKSQPLVQSSLAAGEEHCVTGVVNPYDSVLHPPTAHVFEEGPTMSPRKL